MRSVNQKRGRPRIGDPIKVILDSAVVQVIDRARGETSRSEWIRGAIVYKLNAETIIATPTVDDPVLKELTAAMAEPLTPEEMRPAPIVAAPKVEPKRATQNSVGQKWCVCDFKNDRRTWCSTCNAMVKKEGKA